MGFTDSSIVSDRGLADPVEGRYERNAQEWKSHDIEQIEDFRFRATQFVNFAKTGYS